MSDHSNALYLFIVEITNVTSILYTFRKDLKIFQFKLANQVKILIETRTTSHFNYV